MAKTTTAASDAKKASRPRPGRPVSEEKQLAMREAAIAEFAECGFDRASIDAIAARAGVSKRTLYNHFAGKEELFRALVSEVGRRITVSATIRYSPRRSLQRQIERFVREACDLVMEPQTMRLMRTVIAEHLRHPSRVEPILETHWRNEYGFASWADAACGDGRLHGDAKLIAHSLTSMMRAHVFWPAVIGRLDPSSARFQAEIAEAVDMFLTYYRASRGGPPAAANA